MTPKEIRAELAKIRNTVGLKAYVDVTVKAADYIDDDDDDVVAVLYPFGIGSSEMGGYIRATAPDFAQALKSLSEQWESRKEKHRAELIKKMALAIIRVTTENGECTDAALRQEFDASEVSSVADDACQLADKMAGRGPFKVKRARGANAA